jgi:hypothetical protein
MKKTKQIGLWINGEGNAVCYEMQMEVMMIVIGQWRECLVILRSMVANITIGLIA